MNVEALVEAAGKLGVLGSAIPDIIRRGKERFGESKPTDEQLTGWLGEEKTAAGHLFTPPQPDVPPDVRLSAEERLARGREAPNANKYRAPTITDKAQQAELDTITSPVAKLTRYREMLAQLAQR